MKCIFKRHKFKKVGNTAVGVCLEKYVECNNCKMVIVILNVNPYYKNLYSKFYEPLYYERKILPRKSKNLIKRRLICQDKPQ